MENLNAKIKKYLEWYKQKYGENRSIHSEVCADALACICEQEQRINELELVIMGVMHSVDKWLDGKELEQDAVNRAATMREKTLQIVERLQEENERLHANCTDLTRDLHTVQDVTAQKMREFAFQIIDELLNMMWDKNASCCIVDNCQKSSDIIPCGSEICRVENKALWHEKFDKVAKELLGGEQK